MKGEGNSAWAQNIASLVLLLAKVFDLCKANNIHYFRKHRHKLIELHLKTEDNQMFDLIQLPVTSTCWRLYVDVQEIDGLAKKMFSTPNIIHRLP